MNLQTEALLFSLAALFCWGIGNSMTKKYSRNLNPSKLVVYRNVGSVFITVLALALFGSNSGFVGKDVFLGLALSVAGYVGLLFFLKGLETGNLGLVSPISSSRIVISAIVGTTLLRDHLSGLQWIFIVVIFIGVALSSVDPRNLKASSLLTLKSGIPYALINAVIWGVVYPFYSIPSAILGAYLFAVIIELTGLVLSLIQTKLRKRPIILTPTERKQNLAGLLGVGMLGGLGSVFANLGYATGHVGIVSTVSSAVPFIAVTYGTFVYKERLNRRQAFAVVMVIVGIVLLAYASN